MRIRRLDLLSFGPFSGQSLTFDDGDFGLHLVYGPNEAGKSSSLRALQQLLFGIAPPTKCRDDFVHSHNDLRIGGLFEDRDGRMLEVIRRKGGQNSLRAADDKTVVDPEELNEMLHHIDARRFRTQFGIDYQQLVAGGRDIATGKGDLGASLFAAGSGTADLQKVLKTLEEDGERLFKATGRIPAINKGLADLRAARKRVKETQLAGSDWQRHDQELKQSHEQKAVVDADMARLQAQLNRLQRFTDALPVIAELKPLRKKLQNLTTVPKLRREFGDERREAAADLRNAQSTRTRIQQEIQALEQSLLEVNAPSTLLQHSSAIEELYAELGRYRGLQKECPDLLIRRQQYEQQALRRLQELGKPADLKCAEELRIGPAERQRIRELGEQRSGIFQAVSEATNLLADRSQKLNDVTAELASLQEPKDVAPLQRAIQRINRQGDLDQQLSDAQQLADNTQSQIERDLKKLPLWAGSPEQLEVLPLPSTESINRFERQMEELADREKDVQKERRRLQRELNRITGKLEDIRLQQDVPTEAELTEARQLRDAGWKLLRQHLDGDADDSAVPEFIAKFDGTAELTTAFEKAASQADDIVDRLRREADLVAQKAQLLADMHLTERDLAASGQDLDELRKSQSDVANSWTQLWQASSIQPLPPPDMKAWLEQQAALVESLEELRRQQAAVTALNAELENCRSILCPFLSPEAGDLSDKPLSNLIDLCQQQIDQHGKAAQQHATLRQRLETLEAETATAERQLETAKAEQQTWLTRWADAVAVLGREGDLTPAEAGALLDAVDELFDDIRNERKIAEQAEAKQAEAAEYDQSVRHVTELVAVEIGDMPIAQAVADLNDRLTGARTQQATLTGRQEQIENLTRQLTDVEQNILNQSALLDELCREAGADKIEDLPIIEQQSDERQRLEELLANRESEIRRLARGTDLETFIAQAEAEDADQLEPQIAQLNAQLRELKPDGDRLSESIGSLRRKLDEMDGSAAASHAADEAESILAKLRSDAEQFVRVKLGAGILKRSIERYRERNQGPVLERASQLFAQLTLGAFDALQADYDDNHNPILVGVRPESRRLVPVEGMSEGTCDQLYLALRIASLEAHFAQSDPVPFIVDDILIQFDDARSVAALEVLTELSRQTQVIMFTHHRHIVDLANTHLAETGALFTQSLADAQVVKPEV